MAPEETTALRFLISCPSCKRQYDATRLKAGSRFHCLCGEAVKVPRPEAHDAAVVRCSSCGAPRPRGSAACGHCSAGFTLHERDMHTICPECMTRVSDSAKFCHHCATRLISQGDAGARTDYRCPVCGDNEQLNSRSLGEPAMPLLECPGCAGLWVNTEGFEALLEQARTNPVESPIETGFGSEKLEQQEGPMYRNCPECAKLMNRRNFGRRSGVVVDACKDHGVWFDHAELERVLRWVRRGGEDRVRQSEQDERRMSSKQAMFKQALKSTEWQSDYRPSSEGTLPELLGALLGGWFR